MSAYNGTQPYAFLSYSHKDTERIMPLLEKLQGVGCNIWYDEGIAPGDEWAETIAQKLSEASLFFLVLSENSIASQNVKREIYYAVNHNIPMLTFYLESVSLSQGLAMQLGVSQAVFSSNDVEKDCAALCKVFPKQTEAAPVAEPPAAEQPPKETPPVETKTDAPQKASPKVKKSKKIPLLSMGILAVAIAVGVLLYHFLISPNLEYGRALSLMEEERYEEALVILKELGETEKIAECNAAIPERNYQRALRLFDSGTITEAYEALIALDGYKDSAEKAQAIYSAYKTEKIKSASVGDTVLFGSYEQNGISADGGEEIEWTVLDKKDGKILVISQYCLACRPFHSDSVSATWDASSIRQWLNEAFFTAAFSEEEQGRISAAAVPAHKNPSFPDVAAGTDTTDRVFLLSLDEAKQYFTSAQGMQGKLTPAAEKENETSSLKDGSVWWLRTPGTNGSYTAGVESMGYVFPTGYYRSTTRGIRPAMWITLDN